MADFLDYVRQINLLSVILRQVLAVIFGGLLGMERGRKRRPAGFRTYMLVCLGATLTMMLGQYEVAMAKIRMATSGADLIARTDVARFGAQVINGIGFLGAGTVIVTGRQEVKGLTTAAGLWASACMGLAIGAGFYECVLLAFVLMFLTMRLLPRVENLMLERARNINLYITFRSLDDLGKILDRIKEQNVHIYEVEIDRGQANRKNRPSAILTMKLSQRQPHTQLLSVISDLDCICSIEEL